MNFWLVVGGAALVAGLALIAAACLWRARNHWRRRYARAEHASREFEDQYEQQQGAVALAAAAGAVGRHLRAPLGVLRSQRGAAGKLIERYHELIGEYDAAVRHCLQPVDLMPSADESTLERLVGYVNHSRKRLFTARANLLDSGIPQLLGDRLAQGDQAANHVDRLAGALCCFDEDADDAGEVDLNELVSAALVLTQAHLPPSVRVIRLLEAVPTLPRVAWLAPTLLQLLSLAGDAAGARGRLIARTRMVKRHIEVHIIGHASLSSTDALARWAEQVPHSVQALQYRLERYGASVEMMPASGHGQGMMLCLPIRARALAA